MGPRRLARTLGALGQPLGRLAPLGYLGEPLPFSIASRQGGYAMIMDGLSEGDRVITDPPKGIEMGMQVDVK